MNPSPRPRPFEDSHPRRLHIRHPNDVGEGCAIFGNPLAGKTCNPEEIFAALSASDEDDTHWQRQDDTPHPPEAACSDD